MVSELAQDSHISKCTRMPVYTSACMHACMHMSDVQGDDPTLGIPVSAHADHSLGRSGHKQGQVIQCHLKKHAFYQHGYGEQPGTLNTRGQDLICFPDWLLRAGYHGSGPKAVAMWTVRRLAPALDSAFSASVAQRTSGAAHSETLHLGQGITIRKSLPSLCDTAGQEGQGPGPMQDLINKVNYTLSPQRKEQHKQGGEELLKDSHSSPTVS